VVDGIVRDHRGWVALKSTLGKGTTFEVFLPSVARG
jgi:signal transduction histidine kinase